MEQLDLLNDLQSEVIALEQRIRTLIQMNQESKELRNGYLPIKQAWRKHCNIVTYKVYLDFISVSNMPTKPLAIKRDGYTVNTQQVLVTNVHKLKDYILKDAIPLSTHYYTHKQLNQRFLLKGK